MSNIRNQRKLSAMTFLRLFFALVLSVLFVQQAAAHRSNESYVYFQVSDDAVTGRFEATLADLDKLLSLDSDGNGTVEEAEARAKEAEIYNYLAPRLKIENAGQALTLVPAGLDFLDAGAQGNFAQVKFDVEGLSTVPDALDLHYEPLLDLDPSHFGFVLIESNTRLGLEGNEAYVSLTFDGGDEAKSLSLVGEPWGKVFLEFVEHGIWHIWLGFDHVIFLITLLLASVMGAAGSRWEPLDNFGSGLWNVAKIVTIFTISHSVTLTLAAFNIFTLPIALVEAIIAASIIAVAVMNMFPTLHRHMLWIVFVFGLFHGFGFANVLAPLALDPTRQAVGILAFNLGVEIGQLAIVIVVFPILWMIRRWVGYQFTAFRLGTAALVVIAGMWFVERSFGVDINVRGTIAQLTGSQS